MTIFDRARMRDQLAREIERRKTAERLLRESEERSRALLQSVLTEAVYLLDPLGTINTWNAGAEFIKGYTAEEIIGRNYSVCFTPEDRAAGEPQRVLAQAREHGRYTCEGFRVRKDGSRFFCRINLSAITDADGKLLGFAKGAQDITDTRIDDQQRAIIIEAAPNGMMIVDEAGMITLANSQLERLFGYPAGMLLGQSVEILVPDSFQATHAGLRSGFAGAQNMRSMAAGSQISGRRRDGSLVPIEVLLSTVEARHGRLVIASIFDLTERLRIARVREEAEQRERKVIEETNERLDKLSRHLARARDRAEQASRAKSRFLAAMSHELRTPLNGILGYAQLLRMDGDLTEVQGARVDAMLTAGQHLMEMITCVLDLSEIEADHVTVQAIEMDARAIAMAALDLVRPGADAKGLSLRLAVDPATPPRAVGDPTRLRQVLLNLLGNAVKFTPAGGVELKMSAAEDGSMLRIEVADTGPGIPMQQRNRLFRDFERIEAPSHPGIEGAGLGLALSARLAGLMGGSLRYEDRPGGGSIFRLDIRINQAPPAPSRPASGEAAGEMAGAPPDPALRVLVVDDVAMNRDIAGSFLRAAGHAVTCVEGGIEAVAAAASDIFDVVLMDLRMPEVDGFEATRRIRALPGAHGLVAIVALTAHAFSEQIAQCREAGMAGHVAKPFTQTDLLAAVNAATGLAEVATGAGSQPSPPILDVQTVGAMAAMIEPSRMAGHFQSIAEGVRGLLALMAGQGAAGMSGHDFVDALHRVAGSASLIGFARLGDVARRYEGAVREGAPELPALFNDLTATLKLSLAEAEVRAGAPSPAEPVSPREKAGVLF